MVTLIIIIFFFTKIYPAPPPSLLFSTPHFSIQTLSSIILMPLLPPWYCGLPVDLAACGHVPTPLHCPPLRLFSPVPSPFWPLPTPLLPPPAVSKDRYATLPLYSFRYVIILSSPFYYYCYVARWACLVSCWLCSFYLFFCFF